jgi:hypothetical protein
MAPVMPHTDSRARAQQALRLRGRRKTWAEISAELGYRSRDGARLAVGRLIRTAAPDPDAERAVSTEALRVLQEGLFPRFDEAVERRDDEKAMTLSRELRSLVAEEAKLNGLYAPQSVAVDVSVTSRIEVIDRLESELLALSDANVIEGEVLG